MGDWIEAERRVERAQQLSESQRWAEALAELDAAIAINSDNALWHAQRAFLLEELDRGAEATRAYERSLELDPGDRDVAMALGAVLARQGRYAKALTVFQNLAKQDPQFEPAYCHQIFIYTQLGRHEQAEEMFYLAQELDDACPNCFYYMGESLAMRGLTERALYCWQKVLEIDPDYIGVNHHIAEAMRVKGDLESAREYLLRELRNDPGNTDLLLDLADLALQCGNVEGAIAKLEQVIELDPKNAEAHYELGCILLDREEPGRALTFFEAALTLSEGRPPFHGFDVRYGEALFQCDRPREARVRLERALRKDPQDRRATLFLSECLVSLGLPSEAAEVCQKSLAIEDDDAILHHQLAICLLELGKNEASLRHSLRVIELDPTLADAYFHAAVAAARLRQWKLAKSKLNEVLRIAPDHSPARLLQANLWRLRILRTVRELVQKLRFPGR